MDMDYSLPPVVMTAGETFAGEGEGAPSPE